MTEKETQGAEKIFIRACHEAWRRRLGQIGERVKRQNLSFSSLADREFTRWRTTFARCKNAKTMRAAITDFWSRAEGTLPVLQHGWEEVLPLISGERWREARDLALLALASYKPKDKEEAAALGTQVSDESSQDANAA